MVALSSCEETILPEIQKVDKVEYAGVWNTDAYRVITTYTRLQNLETNNYYYKDTTYTDSTQMIFEFGVSKATGAIVEDSVKITLTQTVKGVIKAPVVKSGYFAISQTSGTDYTDKAIYLNVWEKTSNMHGAIVEPYTTYTILRKSDSEIYLSWVTYENTSQNSKKYKVLVKK